MKNLIYLAVIITCFSCKESSKSSKESTSEEQTTTNTEFQNIPSEALEDLKNVADIKTEFAYITNKIESGNMDSNAFEYNCHDEKKGKVTYYSEKGQLRMIQHTYIEYSHFSATDEYFIKNDSLFFVFNNHRLWSFVNQNQIKDDVTESRFYILDHKLVQCLEKKFTIISNDQDSQKSPAVSNKEIDCPSFEPISKDFELFVKLRNQKEDLVCLQ